jgi:hypothetical protein
LLTFYKLISEYWASFFPKRNLKAYAIHPPIVNPTHYTGEPSHVSDTEHTKIINESSTQQETDSPLDQDPKLMISSTEIDTNQIGQHNEL